jgi:hypothetical protein
MRPIYGPRAVADAASTLASTRKPLFPAASREPSAGLEPSPGSTRITSSLLPRRDGLPSQSRGRYSLARPQVGQARPVRRANGSTNGSRSARSEERPIRPSVRRGTAHSDSYRHPIPNSLRSAGSRIALPSRPSQPRHVTAQSETSPLLLAVADLWWLGGRGRQARRQGGDPSGDVRGRQPGRQGDLGGRRAREPHREDRMSLIDVAEAHLRRRPATAATQ